MKKILLSALFLSSSALAQTCPDRLQLQPATVTSRGQQVIYKSNWHTQENRELTPEEGNHSQKGAALLVHYKAKQWVSPNGVLEVRDLNCKRIASFGRYPRCTTTCGDYERWYLRAPGGSYLTPPELIDLGMGPSVLIRLRGRKWAVVQDVLHDRETEK